MDWRKHIHSHPGILGGKPVVRGTRISVELILEYLAEGGSVAEIIDGYPSLTEADIRAAIAFSSHLMTKEAASARQEAA
ncbi:antitoxin [Sphingomonas lenta]|uniref:Antitoxin n=1 Tax=Sphingomonas lenta TaxID=1141887 RepID=A0A2A2SH83_9SPHN|nr:antitoxin [Sphingomonas lenta]